MANPTVLLFGDRLTQVRKKKKMSQSAIGKILGIDGDAYGRYERGEVKPSVEMATKIAEALQVSLDFLVGKTDMELDNDTLKRVQDITKLPEKEKEHVYAFLDAFLTKMRIQGIL